MRNVILLFTALLVFGACSRKTAPTAPAEPGKTVVVDPPPAEEPEPLPPPVEDLEKKPPQKILIASLKRTACFGQCPAFELRFYNNGVVTYEGKAHVERLGLYESFVNLSVLTEIQNRASEIGYFSLAGKYPTERDPIVDFPNTITFVRMGDQKHSIINNHDAPQALIDFERYLEQLGEERSWRKQ